MVNKLIILGMTYNQIPLIEKAKEMGFYTIAIGVGGGICEEHADKSYSIDFSDIDQVLEIAKKENVRGMVTCGTSTAIYTIACCNDSLHMSDMIPPSEVIKKAVFKQYYREVIHEFVPEGFATFNIENLFRDVSSLKPPILIKPADGGGGKGISVITTINPAELKKAFFYAQSYSKSKKVVCEQFIVGKVIGVESFVIDGKINTLVIPEKIIPQGSNSITKGIIFPSNMTKETIHNIQTVNEQAIDKIGIRWGPTHIDMVVDSSGKPWIIDIGPRLAGGTLMASLVPDYYQYDFYKATIQLAIGNKPKPFFSKPNNMYYASSSVISNKAGILKELEYTDKDIKACHITSVQQLVPNNAPVQSLQNDGDRLLMFTTVADSYDKALDNLKDFEKRVIIKLESMKSE